MFGCRSQVGRTLPVGLAQSQRLARTAGLGLRLLAVGEELALDELARVRQRLVERPGEVEVQCVQHAGVVEAAIVAAVGAAAVAAAVVRQVVGHAGWPIPERHVAAVGVELARLTGDWLELPVEPVARLDAQL